MLGYATLHGPDVTVPHEKASENHNDVGFFKAVRAQLRETVKRILPKYAYPPDKHEKATQKVLEQAALLSEAWAAA